MADAPFETPEEARDALIEAVSGVAVRIPPEMDGQLCGLLWDVASDAIEVLYFIQSIRHEKLDHPHATPPD